jgi:hypothetical protein
MRTRDEIFQQLRGPCPAIAEVITEILLDIRDLIVEEKENDAQKSKDLDLVR